MKKIILIIIFILAITSPAICVQLYPTAYVTHVDMALTTWEQLTDINLSAVTTTDQDSSGGTLYCTATTVFDGCTTDGTSTVICGGQTLTITGITAGSSLTVTGMTGTIASGSAISCGFVLSKSSGSYDATNFVVNGATTTSDYFRVIKAASGASATLSGGGVIFTSTGSAINSTILYSTEGYFGCYNIGFQFTANDTDQRVSVWVDGVANNKFAGCISLGRGGTNCILGFICYSSTYAYFLNCIAVNGGSGATSYGFWNSASTNAIRVYNCYATGNKYGALNSAGSAIIKNSIITGNTTANISGTWTTATNLTTSPTFAADNYHLADYDLLAIDKGTDLSSDFTIDIDLETRPTGAGSWDIGPDENLTYLVDPIHVLENSFNATKDRRVIAMDSNDTGAILLSGTYTGTAPTHVEAKVFRRDTSAVVQINDSDWTQLTTESISGGVWSGVLSAIPKTDAWLGFVVRKSNATGEIYTTGNKIGVGYVVLFSGQSYIDYWLDHGPYTTYTDNTASDLTSKFRHAKTGQIDYTVVPDYTGWALNSGDGAVVFANKLHDVLECPIGVLDYGMGGSALLEENNEIYGYWLGSSSADNRYEDMQDGIMISEPLDRIKFNSVLWYQGWTDCKNGVTYSDYYSGLHDLLINFASDANFAGLPIFIIQQPRDETGSTGTDAAFSAVRQAQADISSDYYYFAGSSIDMSLFATDHVHLTEAAQEIEALRYAQSILYHENGTGDYTYYRGPRNVGYRIVDATHTDVYLAHSGGTDFTPTTGIDSYSVKIGATWYSGANCVGARQSATIVRLTHTNGAVIGVRCLYGRNPAIANILKDNSGLSLPIEADLSIPQYGAAQIF